MFLELARVVPNVDITLHSPVMNHLRNRSTTTSRSFALSRSILASCLGFNCVSTFDATRACAPNPDSLGSWTPFLKTERRLQRQPFRIYRCDLADRLVVGGRIRAGVRCCGSRYLQVERSAGLGLGLVGGGRWDGKVVSCMGLFVIIGTGR
jgi:hypothetical protein